MKLLFQDSDKEIDTNSDPYLSFHGVRRCSVKPFDTQVLFDPLEEEFDLPSTAIQFGYCDCRQREIVGKENHSSSCFQVQKADSSEHIRIGLAGRVRSEPDTLVALQPDRAVGLSGIDASELEILLGSDNEERSILMEGIESFEIQITTVHDVKRSWFWDERIEDVHLVRKGLGDAHESWDIAIQIYERVQFDSRLVLSESRPREKVETEVDSCGVQCINGLLQVEAKILVGVKRSGDTDKHLCKIRIDAPVSLFVGICECTPSNMTTDSHMIKSTTNSSQAGLDIAKTFALCQLRKSHGVELISAREVLDFVISSITSHTLPELVIRKRIHNLSKDESSTIHEETLLKIGLILQNKVDIDQKSSR
jgi:hypothetical protein